MLPRVDFCGLEITRLIIGANPFGGFSHQSPERDRAMLAYHTSERILETWKRAEEAGINTMVTNNETPHIVGAVRKYLGNGGRLQWIAQVADPENNMPEAIDRAVKIGAKAIFFLGGLIDKLFAERDEKALRSWVENVRLHGVPVGVAGHSAETHEWVDGMNLVDFHVVSFFKCGSLHYGSGYRFRLADAITATDCIRHLRKPCIGYKIMAAGRIDPAMAFEFAFSSIKSTDVVNVGMHRGDKDNMVEENVATVERILGN